LVLVFGYFKHEKMNKYDDNKQDIRKELGMFHIIDEISGNNCYLLNRIRFLRNLLFCFYIQKPKPMHLCQPRFDPKNFYSFQVIFSTAPNYMVITVITRIVPFLIK
jgi:hypothetical protein